MLSQGEKSADFPKDPFCEVSRMTNTTCARYENSFLNRADGMPRPASLGEKITAAHITSLYKMRSRIGSKVILRGVKIRREERHAISGFLLPFKNLENQQRHIQCFRWRVSIHQKQMTRTLFIAQKPMELRNEISEE